MLNLIGIKIKNKKETLSCFLVSHHNIKEQQNNRYHNPYCSIEKFTIDGEHPQISYHDCWSILKKEPIVVQRTANKPNINQRYELIDKSMVSDKIPLTIKEKDATYIKDGYTEWHDKYAMYQSLYEFKSDKQPDILEDVEFTYKTILEVDQMPNDQSGWSYEICGEYSHKPLKKIAAKDILHQLVDKIVFPPVILSTRPCALTSQQSFDIVRNYIKDNIDPKYANITRDYDFCFTVQKRIKLAEQETYRVDVNNSWFNKRKRKSKFITKYRTERNVTCFQMAPKSYQSYSIIDGFRGDNHEDLQNNIDSYCKNLIEHINEPVIDCKHCNGRGVIIDE